MMQVSVALEPSREHACEIGQAQVLADAEVRWPEVKEEIEAH
jgi:hypothetical protein